MKRSQFLEPIDPDFANNTVYLIKSEIYIFFLFDVFGKRMTISFYQKGNI